MLMISGIVTGVKGCHVDSYVTVIEVTCFHRSFAAFEAVGNDGINLLVINNHNILGLYWCYNLMVVVWIR